MIITATDYNAKPKKTVKKRPMGRQPGMVHLKPLPSIEGFIADLGLEDMAIEHPFITDIKMLENPYMKATLARADVKKSTIELSEKALKGKTGVLRDVFIKMLCHFIAVKMFAHSGKGEPFKLLVARYSAKTKKAPITNGETGLIPKSFSVKH